MNIIVFLNKHNNNIYTIIRHLLMYPMIVLYILLVNIFEYSKKRTLFFIKLKTQEYYQYHFLRH
jgi:hypothetical protein